jgi:hypothetical protein
MRAFNFFRMKFAVTLSGFFDSNFLTCDILQIAQQEKTVRHAIVALASLSESMLKTTTNSADDPPESCALRQHAGAMTGLRKRIQQSSDCSTEVIHMCSVHLYCHVSKPT